MELRGDLQIYVTVVEFVSSFHTVGRGHLGRHSNP